MADQDQRKRFSTDRQVAALSVLPGQRQTEYYHSTVQGLVLRVGPTQKTWAVKYVLDGQRKKITLPLPYPETTLAEAVNECKRIRADATRGIDPLGKKKKRRIAPTIQDVMDLYFKESPLTEKGRAEAERISQKDIVPLLGDMKAMELRRQDVKDLHRNIVDRGAPVAANRTVELLRRAYNCAHEEELIETNPFPSIKKIKAPENTRGRVLTDPEIKALWKAMEEAIPIWQLLKEPLQVFDWPKSNSQSTNQPAIHFFNGKIKDLPSSDLPENLKATLTVIPRPNQAFWSLSALWTGWIWGREAVLPIRQVLARQRYDWNWHANALGSVFEALSSLPIPAQNIWGLVAEDEPMFLIASLLAANTSGFNLTAFSQSEDDQIAQCLWRQKFYTPKNIKPDEALDHARRAAREFLEQKGGPASYQKIHTAMITSLAQQNELAVEIFQQNRNQTTSETQKLIETVFKEPGFLLQVGEKASSLEAGDFWLVKPQDIQPPMIDRLEEQIIRLLISEGSITSEQVKTVSFQAFPGLFTPRQRQLLNCLESYADMVNPQEHLWQLRETETPAKRRKDVHEIRDLLKSIGQRLNYEVTGEDPVFWKEGDKSQPAFGFHVFSSAMIFRHLEKPGDTASLKMMVFPGSRANLLAYKKQHNPGLRSRLQQNCVEVKFRLVRDLAANPLLTRQLFMEQIKADPPEYHASQLALF